MLQEKREEVAVEVAVKDLQGGAEQITECERVDDQLLVSQKRK